ncbi:hypothetical protein [Streptomyces sp. NPDC058451]|uniref:hypothetical protein n=1 Tax=Streptomyces sp. NPDC058451 TaxID=3346506 RepID=UPI00364CD3D1
MRGLHVSHDARERITSCTDMRGWAAGFAEGRATAVLRLLQGRDIEVTGDTWERVTACSDLAALTRWLKLATTVTRAEHLFTESQA